MAYITITNNDIRKRRPLVYVAGPYTRPDPVSNVRATIPYAEAVREAGCTPLVPHLFMLWDLVSPHPYEYWTSMDMELLARCDALIRLPGESSGAEAEVNYATQQLQIPVLILPSLSGQASSPDSWRQHVLDFCRRQSSN
jgi:nucleoside 2-deoxyribosyltransferase